MDKKEIVGLLMEFGGEPCVVRKFLKTNPIFYRGDEKIFERFFFEIEKQGIKLLFPSELGVNENEFLDPPLLLFLKGDFPKEKPRIGIVGTRNPDIYGIEVTKFLVKTYTRAGFVILSGGAVGIDTIAHQEAISQGGESIAILGSGFNFLYPHENIELFKKMLLISEYPPQTKPLKRHFPERNRLIAGFSDVLIIIEGGEDSGALITARIGVKTKKPTFTIVGDMWYRNSKGCNLLLKEGAMPLLKPRDILKFMKKDLKINSEIIKDFPQGGLRPPYKPKGWTDEEEERKKRILKEREEKIINILSKSPLHFDEIVENTGLNSQTLSHTLIELEMEGIIKKMEGDFYIMIPQE